MNGKDKKIYGLSEKSIKNKPTLLRRVSNVKTFLSNSNKKYMIKQLYLRYRENNSYLIDTNLQDFKKGSYSYLKSNVPPRMERWIKEKENNGNEINKLYHLWDDITILDYINKMFIEENCDFYSPVKEECGYLPVDYNVYKANKTIGYFNEGDETLIKTKPANELLAQDFQNLDVWGYERTYNDHTVYRYNNKIPIWQTSMNIRHYDRSNQGLHSYAPEGASWNNLIYMQGGNLDELFQKKEKLIKKYKNIQNEQ